MSSAYLPSIASEVADDVPAVGDVSQQAILGQRDGCWYDAAVTAHNLAAERQQIRKVRQCDCSNVGSVATASVCVVDSIADIAHQQAASARHFVHQTVWWRSTADAAHQQTAPARHFVSHICKPLFQVTLSACCNLWFNLMTTSSNLQKWGSSAPSLRGNVDSGLVTDLQNEDARRCRVEDAEAVVLSSQLQLRPRHAIHLQLSNRIQ